MAYLNDMFNNMEYTGGYNMPTQKTAPMGDPFTGPAQVSYGGGSPTQGGIPNLYGKWTSYAGTTEGDRWSQGPQGVWDLDPTVDYGAPPEPGMTPFFGNDGRIAGWGGARTGDAGMGLFGNFGGDQTRSTYFYNPDGTLRKDQEVHSPSRDSMTNFMSYAVPIGMAAGAATQMPGFLASQGLTGAPSAVGAEGAIGSLGVEPIAGSGFSMGSGGATAFGQPFSAGATLAGAGEAGGSLMGLSNLAGVGGAASSGMSALNKITDLVSKGMDISKAVQMVQGGGQGQGGGGMGSLLDLISGYMGNKNLKDYAGNAKEPYSDAVGRQKPFLDQLLASYQDPNTFYNSNQWKGLESVYQNSIDRDAAKSGRLANPTDREVLLQQHAMKGLEDYRRGLAGAAGITNPAQFLSPYSEGIKAEASAGAQAGLNAALGRMRTGGGTPNDFQNVIKTITDAGSTVEDIWDFVSGWFK
jgi:hypothetical protein